VVDISQDGRFLLFSESGEAGGSRYGVYLRATDGSPPVRLGEGRPLALSPDGAWALTVPLDPPPRLVLLPTGTGQPRSLASKAITQYQWGTFFPDGKRLLTLGNEPGGDLRLFVQDLAGGEARPILPPGVATVSNTISPDGLRIIALDARGARLPAVYPIAGGPPQPLPGLEPGEEPLRWSADGRSVFLGSRDDSGIHVLRLDVASGRKELPKTLKPPDGAGVVEVRGGVMTPDGSAYAYNDRRVLSDLYVVTGIR
jgi:eukaryotic-like serine/threonine-protein kinase